MRNHEFDSIEQFANQREGLKHAYANIQRHIAALVAAETVFAEPVLPPAPAPTYEKLTAGQIHQRSLAGEGTIIHFFKR